MNKVNHKVVKPYRLKEHSVNVRAVRTESSSFYSERCSVVVSQNTKALSTEIPEHRVLQFRNTAKFVSVG